ncbi:MAG: type II secretion system secretin GspD [Nitrospira sp.]|nr:type II secretion system secretin GspD [bacterium]MBL7049522.1 type II secretion system secretin GspD [Nitrospira sp.]
MNIKHSLIVCGITLLTILVIFDSVSAQDAQSARGDLTPPGAGMFNPGMLPDLPEDIPPGSITPNQIKSFFAKPPVKPTMKPAVKTNQENYIILNFDNANLKDVLNTVASITSENFILSPGLDARITIHSSKKIPVSEVLDVFESVLEANGMSLVRSGDFYKVVSSSTAKQKPLEVRTGKDISDIPDLDRPVTQIVSVDYVPVTEINTVLTPLLSAAGSIIPNTRHNLLIINDMSSSIIRLLQILKEIDVNAFENSRMTLFQPKYSDVASLSNELTEVLNALNITKEGIALVPIERINSLIVFSSSELMLKSIEGWMKKLDEEVMTGQNVFVHPVQNVKAESIASILSTLYEATTSTTKRTASTAAATAGKRTAPPRVTSPRSSKQSSGLSRIEVIAFEPTNSLVILAPPGIYREMVETIKKIDVYPREVLIEAVIAEVTLSESEKLGFQWSALHNLSVSGRDITALAQGNRTTDIPQLVSSVPALASGPSGGISYLLFRPEKFTALIHALSSESRVNILSSPRLLVRDQEEASIEVGSEIPTATSTTQTTTTDTLTQNIEYRTVGIKLKIKPTISEEKTVVLDIEQEVSSKGDNITVGSEGTSFPSFSTTKAKTSIVVPDKQGIIIGGIMEETTDKNYQGVPFFSKIPVLGRLFRYQVDEVRKKELVIIITPHVISSILEAEKLTNDYVGKLRELKQVIVNRESLVSGSE